MNGDNRPLRVHLLGAGDVGSTLLLGLRLLGGGDIGALGLYELNSKLAARWELELNQINSADLSRPLPPVELISEQQLFNCDVFVFCATAGVPPLSATADVRLAQYAANAAILRRYAVQARQAQFRGLFAVVSDPVEPLCVSARQAACCGPNDGLNGPVLASTQIVGFGLGVMAARAAYFAQREPRFAAYLQQGRVYGAHGQGLVVVIDPVRYDDALSQELTKLVLEANLACRGLGYKPYVAPALSSGALALLDNLRGQWHYSSLAEEGCFFGQLNRRVAGQIELEETPLHPRLQQRLEQSRAYLRSLEVL